MTTRLVLASLLVSATASAQAPGEVPSSAPGMVEPAPVAPVVVAPAPAIDPLAHRFAVGLNVGTFGVAAEDAPEGSSTDFDVAELALRFRATRRLEVFLQFTGGRQVLDDGETGDLATDMVTLGARFNFRPEHRWNWFGLIGFGSTLIADHDTPEELRDDMRRGHVLLGLGVERRWRRFGVQAELRGISIAEPDMTTIEPAIVDGNGTTTTASSGKLGGGQFSLGGAFYF